MDLAPTAWRPPGRALNVAANDTATERGGYNADSGVGEKYMFAY